MRRRDGVRRSGEHIPEGGQAMERVGDRKTEHRDD